MELINAEQATIIAKEQVDRYGHEIWVIGPPGSDKILSRITGVNPANFHWLSEPEKLKGHYQPVVVIMPNWWRHDYRGMEEILNLVEARVFNVYLGRKPIWKNQPSSMQELPEYPSTPREALPSTSGEGEGQES